MKQSQIPSLLEHLSMMSRADLPLPQGIQALTRTLRGRAAKQMLERMGQRVEDGQRLSDAMREESTFFKPVYVEMAALGEEHGVLGELLLEAARFAQMQQEMLATIRQKMVYPVIMFFVSVMILFGIMYGVTPTLVEITRDLTDGAPLPLTLSLTGTISDVLHVYTEVWVTAYVVALVVTFWMLVSNGVGLRLGLWALQHVPRGQHMLAMADQARMCALLGLYMKRGIPMTTALRQASLVMTTEAFREATLEWATLLEQGRSLTEILQGYEVVDMALLTAVSQGEEEHVADHVARLTESFRTRTEVACDMFVLWWSGAGSIVLTLCAANVVFLLFTPLVEIMNAMVELL